MKFGFCYVAPKLFCVFFGKCFYHDISQRFVLVFCFFIRLTAKKRNISGILASASLQPVHFSGMQFVSLKHIAFLFFEIQSMGKLWLFRISTFARHTHRQWTRVSANFCKLILWFINWLKTLPSLLSLFISSLSFGKWEHFEQKLSKYCDKSPSLEFF